MMIYLRQLWGILTPASRRSTIYVLLLFIPVALFEAIGIASILPFIMVVSDTTKIESNPLLRHLYLMLGASTPREFSLWLGVGVLALVLFTNLLGAFSIYVVQRYCARQHHNLCQRLLSHYLSQPYLFFVHRNSSTAVKNILSEVQHFVYGVLLPTIDVAAKLLTTATVFILLMIVDPLLTLVSGFVLGVIYLLAYMGVRRRLATINSTLADVNTRRFKIVSEAFSNIKLLKLLSLEKFYVDQFNPFSRSYTESCFHHETISRTTRYMVETIALGGAVVMIVAFLLQNHQSSHVISMIGMYAFAAYRLLPSVQNIFLSVAKIRSFTGVMRVLAHEMDDEKKENFSNNPLSQKSRVFGQSSSLSFERTLELKNIKFTYPLAQGALFEHLNVTIQKQGCVGIVGKTGSGKTTLVDLIMGLVTAQEGEIYVDGVRLTSENLRAWQEKIGYVPQHIYLIDDTIAANIALGVERNQLDMERVRNAAKSAQMEEFIEYHLPQGYQTMVGERGSRLSGGQIQRIGIARALYHNPEVIIFDEATSALDHSTEQAVIQALFDLAQTKTLIIIAHRLETIRRCSHILLLEHGKIIDEGSFDKLFKKANILHAFNNSSLVVGED